MGLITGFRKRRAIRQYMRKLPRLLKKDSPHAYQRINLSVKRDLILEGDDGESRSDRF